VLGPFERADPKLHTWLVAHVRDMIQTLFGERKDG
jgi:hypothetical protein